MVSKSLKRTPSKSIRDRRAIHRRNRKRSPVKIKTDAANSSAMFSSIRKTIFSCKRRLSKIFSKLACIGTPSSRYKGYNKILKTGIKKMQSNSSAKPTICRTLFGDEKLPPLISQEEKRTVFLDLDETLVHSKADPPPQVFDFVVRPVIDGEVMNFYVLKRPGVDEFLELMAEKFELVVFTAGLREYASLVLDRLDVKGLISHRLYRDSCKAVDGKYIKDLSEMGREMKCVAIVDDNPNCYMFQPENAIPVRAFTDDLGDRELGKLVKFFYGCDCFEDMRDAVKNYVSERQNENIKL